MLDQRDKRLAAEAQQKALESAPAGRPVAWTNPDSGHQGTVTPVRTYQSGGTYCREFQSDVVIGGKNEKAYGTACRQPDGRWKVRAERSDTMRTGIFCLTAAALGLLLIHVPAAAQTAASPDVGVWMIKQDGNGDGKLDRGEFHQAVVEAFFLRDKDKNGFLAITELTEASPEALKAIKRKDDGRISLQEYVSALFKDFEAANTDPDGLLTVEEIEVYRQRTRSRSTRQAPPSPPSPLRCVRSRRRPAPAGIDSVDPRSPTFRVSLVSTSAPAGRQEAPTARPPRHVRGVPSRFLGAEKAPGSDSARVAPARSDPAGPGAVLSEVRSCTSFDSA